MCQERHSFWHGPCHWKQPQGERPTALGHRSYNRTCGAIQSPVSLIVLRCVASGSKCKRPRLTLAAERCVVMPIYAPPLGLWSSTLSPRLLHGTLENKPHPAIQDVRKRVSGANGTQKGKGDTWKREQETIPLCRVRQGTGTKRRQV